MNMNSAMGFPYQIINLAFMLPHTTNDDEMIQKKRFTFENFAILKYI
jgi:hypothetical protein